MAISPKCDMQLSVSCEGELRQYGAILFGPPDEDGYTRKRHLCVPCYGQVLETSAAAVLATTQSGGERGMTE